MNKYRNKPTTVDGVRFASKAEARRYAELRVLEKAGQISDLELQPVYHLRVLEPYKGSMKTQNLIPVGKYVADFTYTNDGKTVVEDVKGIETALFKWKRKHFEAEYGIKLRLIKSGRMQREIDG